MRYLRPRTLAFSGASIHDNTQLGDAWFLDEVFVSIQGEQQYLWRAVDQDGDTIDILVQRRRNQQTAERFFRRLIKGQGGEPRWLVTDSFHRESLPIAVIPDIRNRESILVSFRMDTRYKLRV